MNDEVMLPRPKVDWRMVALVVLACVATGLIGLTLPFAANASNTGDALARSDEVTGCRSTANAAVTDARTSVDGLNVDNGILSNQFQEALLASDLDALKLIRPQLPVVRDAMEAAKATLQERNDVYQDAVALSTSDERKFLALCREGRFDPVGTTTTTLPPFDRQVIGDTTTTTALKATTPRRTTTTRATSTTGTTSTTVHRSSPSPTTTPCAETLPLPSIPGVPCL